MRNLIAGCIFIGVLCSSVFAASTSSNTIWTVPTHQSTVVASSTVPSYSATLPVDTTSPSSGNTSYPSSTPVSSYAVPQHNVPYYSAPVANALSSPTVSTWNWSSSPTTPVAAQAGVWSPSGTLSATGGFHPAMASWYVAPTTSPASSGSVGVIGQLGSGGSVGARDANPEPATIFLTVGGFAGLILMRRRMRKQV